ncbi:MAG: HD domain-containing protein [Calothrix sp. SM1_5_4]|nr:HD domain-containing protein [Calothrix sp. SM1_5_4]
MSSRGREIFKALRAEREERRKRQDSIANYLEPNLKFGAGGLRDIEQALALRKLFADAFRDADPYPFEVLAEIKEELLYLRCYLHLLRSGDVLTAQDQLELARRLNMGSARELMTFIQSELERASFYADWVVAYGAASRKARGNAHETFSSLNDVLYKLRENPSVFRQFEIRRTVNDWFKPLSAVEIGRALQRALYEPQDDAYLVGLYRTRLLEGFLPEFKQIRGLVQHDHYHRFTVDAHLVQTLREVQRAQSSLKGRTWGAVGKLAKELGPHDWWVLKLTALFHDLAKGRKGDHSSEGAKLVDKYFAQWEYPEGLREDVRWLVDNHLILSTAAFRQNPQAQSTWKRLFERGVEGRRLTWLALFTAIDIRSTNPEAWTDWKAQLLYDLVQNLRSPRAQSLQRTSSTRPGPSSKARRTGFLRSTRFCWSL